MTYWGGTERMHRTMQVVNMFQKKYPALQVNSQATDWQGYWNKLATQIAGGRIPDLIQMDTRYLALYIRKNLLLNLSPYIPKQLSLADFDQELLKGNELNAAIYGVPLGGQYVALVINRDILEKAHMQPPDEHLTWQTFATYTQQITASLGAKIYGTGDASGSIPLFELFIRQKGKELFTADGKLNIERQDVIEWWTYWEELRRSGGCIPADQQGSNQSYDPSQSLLVLGKVAMDFATTNFLETFQQLTPHTLALVLPPTGQHPGMYFKATMLLSGSAKTSYAQDVVSFINFFIHDSGAIKALGMDRGLPGSAKARELLKPDMTPAQQKELAYIQQVSTSQNSAPKRLLDPPGAGQVEQILGRMAQAVSFHQQSIGAAADSFLAQSEQALKEKAA
ncbi:ABC transporter substrate-binding protein [Ktedonosporobacter rubrisoli]|nr:ABC transporter substrate-binding protein [Ktedonosporobacter rubrisoli]